MATEREAGALLLVEKPLALRPWGHARKLEGLGGAGGAPEEARLLREVRGSLRELDRGAERGCEARAIGLDRIEGARLDECFHRAPVHDAPVDAPAEIGEVPEWPLCSARRHDVGDRARSGSLDGSQPIEDATRVDGLESPGAEVHVRRGDGEAVL